MFSSSKGINLGQGSAGGGGGGEGPPGLPRGGRGRGGGGGEGSLRTQTYFRSSLLSTRKRVETEKPRRLSQTPARLTSIAFFPTAEPGARLVLHKTSYNIRTFQVVVVQWTSRKCTTKHDAREN